MFSRLSSIAVIACIVTLAIASPARADWPAAGKFALQTQVNPYAGRARLYEASNGDLFVLGSSSGGNSSYWRCVRLTRDGEFAAGWDTMGTNLGYALRMYGFQWQGFAPDDSGGFWRGCYNYPGVEAGHALPANVQEPPGAMIGWHVPLASSGAYITGVDVAEVSGSSDVYVSAGARVQRFTRAGGRAAGWPATGRAAVDSLATAFQSPLLPDGSGGVILFAPGYLYSTEAPRVGRVDGNSAIHVGWPQAGLVLGAPVNILYEVNWPIQRLVPSGPNHAIAMWTDCLDPDQLANGKIAVYLQRFSFDGTLDPSWPVNGVQVVSPDTISALTLVADGEEGAFVLWERSGRPRGTHVLANGQFAIGLGGGGVPLIPAGTPYASTGAPSSWVYTLVADHGLDGGLVFAWCDSASNHARWLRSDLTPEPSEPGDVLLPFANFPDGTIGIMDLYWSIADGYGGLFLLAEGVHDGHAGYFVARVSRPSFAGVTPRSAPTSLALGAAMPNPVRRGVALRVTLPDERPARLELFDVSGRRWRSADIRGAGEHVQRFDDLAGLAPGLYLARLTHGGQSRTARFVRLP